MTRRRNDPQLVRGQYAMIGETRAVPDDVELPLRVRSRGVVFVASK